MIATIGKPQAISGTFLGNVSMQAGISIPDQPTHALALASVSGVQTSPNSPWEGAKMTYWGYGDLVAGEGKQSGYFRNEHLNGDTTFGTFEGDVRVSGIEARLEGKWQLKSGTGQLSGVAGGGSFVAHTINPITIQMEWSGEYSLPGDA